MSWLIKSASVLTFAILIGTGVLFGVFQNEPDQQQGIGQLIGGAAAAISFLWIIVQLRIQYYQLKTQEVEIEKQRKSIYENTRLTRVQTILQLGPVVTRILDRICRTIIRDLTASGLRSGALADVPISTAEYPYITCLDNTSKLMSLLAAYKNTPYWRSLSMSMELYVQQYDSLVSFEGISIPESDRILNNLLKNSPEYHVYSVFRKLISDRPTSA